MGDKLTAFVSRKLGPGTASGDERQHACPFCIDRIGSESDKPKLWVNYRKGKAVCYRCGYAAGSLLRLARDINGEQLPESLLDEREEAPERSGQAVYGDVLLKFFAKTRKTKLRRHRLPPCRPVWQDYKAGRITAINRKAIAYLKRRGIEPEVVAEYRVHYATGGHYRGYLVFPVYQGGKPVYFTTRYAGDHDVKTLNPPNLPGHLAKSDVLLNYDNVLGQPTVALCEGPFSAMAWKYGVATLGKTISNAQVALFHQLVVGGLREVVVSYDDDATTWAIQACDALRAVVPTVTRVHFEKGDPDDNRERLADYLDHRRAPSTSDRVRARLRLPLDAKRFPLTC